MKINISKLKMRAAARHFAPTFEELQNMTDVTVEMKWVIEVNIKGRTWIPYAEDGVILVFSAKDAAESFIAKLRLKEAR